MKTKEEQEVSTLGNGKDFGSDWWCVPGRQFMRVPWR